MNKSNVIARLTVARQDGRRTIVEIHSNATFNAFYHVYVQMGRRWSTKRLVRMASRNEGLMAINAHLQQPGLDAFAKRIAVFQSTTNPVVTSKIQIIKKRAYRKLLRARPDELGMVKTTVNLPWKRFSSQAREARKPIRVRLHISEAVAA